MSDAIKRWTSVGALIIGLIALFVASVSTPVWDTFTLAVPGAVFTIIALLLSRQISDGDVRRAVMIGAVTVLAIMILATALYFGIPGK